MLNEIDLKLIQLGLEEDLGKALVDVTSDLLFSGQHFYPERAVIISKHPTDVVVSGLACVEPILAVIARGVKCDVAIQVPDGGTLHPGETLLSLEGNPIFLLKSERLLLNFIRHLSAVATMTAQFVKAVQGTNAKILDTRKTTPGFRHLEKMAVHCGGGVNHRMGLYDAIMIKDTHVDLVGGMKAALGKLPLLKDSAFSAIVEVRSIEELHVVLDHGRDKVSRVLLDNIRGDALAECVRAAKGVFETEASGNVTLANVREIAQSGVEFISVGMITHSAGQVDLSMKSMAHA